ncbi:methionine--tRNA ligase [Micrococcales bacterium 31B]|nr:methionine--tRNA ligase [Micrococcales bacterium 31B]
MVSAESTTPVHDAAAGKAFYVTTPIYYVSAAPHIGNAYTSVAGDFLTRWHRQRQAPVWYLTGTDEHGEKVLRSAETAGKDPQSFTDELVASAWQPMLNTVDIANDDFIRTTQPRHVERVQRALTAFYERGDIYLGEFEGLYCVGCEEFKLPGDLEPGEGEYEGQMVCPMHGKPPKSVAEKNYFFKLSAYVDKLLAHYEANREFVVPESSYNEMVSFIKSDLRDLSISRTSFDWGIPLPWDPEHVCYVWFEALLNYTTAVGLFDEPGSEGAAKFAGTWPADVHLVGKDIARFHSVTWPAMLMSLGLDLPKQIFAHGWLLVGGKKMSKSKLTAISPNDITDVFGSDAYRYYFMRAITFGGDGSFSWEDLGARYNNDLANGLGNLASRNAAMIGKYFGGSLPAAGEATAAEAAVRELAEQSIAAAEAAIDRVALHEAVSSVWQMVDRANLYITEQAPWVLGKQADQLVDGSRLATVLVTVSESLRVIAVGLNALMPKVSAQLWESLGAPAALGSLAEQPIQTAAAWGRLPAGTPITKVNLFPRIDLAALEADEA